MSNFFTTPKGTKLPFLNLKGKDYLQVAHRIQWFREEHLNYSILTEITQQTDKFISVKASVLNEKGTVLQQAHKTEHFAHFADALEKAETGAVGRALAMLGYGTQFAQELVEAESGDRLADSPLPNRITQQKPQVANTGQNPNVVNMSNLNEEGYLIMPFGPNKGRPVKGMSAQELDRAIKWAKSKNKYLDWVWKAETYLKNELKDPELGFTNQPPPPSDEDNIPF